MEPTVRRRRHRVPPTSVGRGVTHVAQLRSYSRLERGLRAGISQLVRSRRHLRRRDSLFGFRIADPAIELISEPRRVDYRTNVTRSRRKEGTVVIIKRFLMTAVLTFLAVGCFSNTVYSATGSECLPVEDVQTFSGSGGYTQDCFVNALRWHQLTSEQCRASSLDFETSEIYPALENLYDLAVTDAQDAIDAAVDAYVRSMEEQGCTLEAQSGDTTIPDPAWGARVVSGPGAICPPPGQNGGSYDSTSTWNADLTPGSGRSTEEYRYQANPWYIYHPPSGRWYFYANISCLARVSYTTPPVTFWWSCCDGEPVQIDLGVATTFLADR